ncbi:FtsK/SpoIIIE domain-containing protein [Pelomonas sp. APW6]|uniref:FtsK/SpoIIIE domain-containing protein n=1 Tax=Roseateles subflavus TaxID=3053353 RepID=A0ABT7LDM6_9BURK|nr:FtsK/SpoIIIE domain-containing protein [Pelomonas sp. APW6]MDL5030963.1 FtsK/SpoIIIE domain-containing protein [Pelomonas sp. APW6]
MHQCFRIKNLHADEVVQFVEAWPEAARTAQLEQVRLVVADGLDGALPPQFVAESGYSITHYRNHNPNGLVYIESSVQSDEQGLKDIFSLRDSNFLDGSFDDYARTNRGIPGLLIEEAWHSAGGTSGVPQLLLERLLLVIRLVHPEIEPVPVRRYVAFVESVCAKWLGHDRVIDEAQADRIVGSSLWAMDMFPDERWNEGGAEARCRRRLEMNARHADLLDGTTELAAEEVAARSLAARFKLSDGSPMPTSDAINWRELCSNYGLTPTDELRKQIPYEIFCQLFIRDTAGLRLGERVRAELESSAPGRLGEFDALDVTAGLNARNSLDANRLLEAVPAEGTTSLIDALTASTRKSVERLAAPPRRQFFNPAIEIVRLVQRVRTDATAARVASISMEIGREDASGQPIHGLFAFLFGDTLRSIAAGLEGLPDACLLELSDELIHPLPVPPLLDDQSDESEDVVQQYSWDPLPLRFTLRDSNGKTLEVIDQMEWLPSAVEQFALFWFLAAAPESPALDLPGTLRINQPTDGDDWRTPLAYREAGLDGLTLDPAHRPETSSPVLEELLALRHELRDALRELGLAADRIQSFLDSWLALLQRAREHFVPDGSRSREFDAFLGTDLAAIVGSERRLMLPLHPIRLRWICRYLEQTRRLAHEFLAGTASFSDGEGEFYLDWLEKLTPRESPPIAAGSMGQLLYSRSESGWWEDFSPLEAVNGDVSFDAAAVGSIAARIVSYLDAHPYKRDGLSLLVVLPTNDSMPAEILRRITAKANRYLRISMHVAAPKSRWEAIARAVEKVSDGGESSPQARLFPDKDLALIDYKAGDSLAGLLADLQLDIAVVTHVLQEQIVSQQNTEAPVERPGVFDPLQHRPLRLEAGGGGGAISLVMLPKYPDPVLESWSTLTVRANRSRPVAPGQPENTDLVELRVNFQDSARLFKDLHEHCHWVITLERQISREQIESAEAGAPDVLSIEDGVGANRLNTLVVSSRSGRELIQARLARKLRRLIPQQTLSGASHDLLDRLAEGIYDSTRRLAPRLALQALGVARVTEEIIGLTVARSLAEEIYPARLRSGLVAWISLDEHTDWFGGHAQVRADMCRLSLERGDDGVIDVDVLVVEGKLRQLYDGHGVVQVQRTCEFFRSVLAASGTDAARNVDESMWREQIASAVENLPVGAIQLVGAESNDSRNASPDLMHLTIADLRSGSIRLRSVNGVYSACLWDTESQDLQRSDVDGITVLRSTRFHLVDHVQRSEGITTRQASVEPPHRSLQNEGAPSQGPLPLGIPVAFESERNGAVAEADHPVESAVPEPASEGLSQTLATSGQMSAPTDGTGASDLPLATSRNRGLSNEVLRRTYEDILGCFAIHGITVSAAQDEELPFVEGPASILFKVRPGPGVDPRKLSEKGAALKLVLQLEQDQNVTFNIDRGFVTIDVPKRAEQRYFVDAVETWSRWRRPPTALTVPIGEDRFGQLVELNFSSSNSPHLLVAGTTGSGKSEALNTILFGLTRHYRSDELRLMLVDPKGTELAPFDGSSYLEGSIGWDDADAIELLKTAVEEMQQRYQAFKNAGKRNLAEFNAGVPAADRLPWWLVVLDEYADLTHDPMGKKEIEAELKRLAQKARAAGIHVIIATQKPSAEVISTNLRSNLPAQLALRVKSATESRVVIDEAGAENLNGKGDGLLKADGRLVRVQCSRVDPSAWPAALSGPAA